MTEHLRKRDLVFHDAEVLAGAEPEPVERAESTEAALVDGRVIDAVERGRVLPGEGEGERARPVAGREVHRHRVEPTRLVGEDSGPKRESELDSAPVVRQRNAELGTATATVVVVVQRDRAERIGEGGPLGAWRSEKAGEDARHVGPISHDAVVRRVEIDHPIIRVDDGFHDPARTLDDEVVRRIGPRPRRSDGPAVGDGLVPLHHRQRNRHALLRPVGEAEPHVDGEHAGLVASERDRRASLARHLLSGDAIQAVIVALAVEKLLEQPVELEAADVLSDRLHVGRVGVAKREALDVGAQEGIPRSVAHHVAEEVREGFPGGVRRGTVTSIRLEPVGRFARPFVEAQQLEPGNRLAGAAMVDGDHGGPVWTA